jgi:hypothetical protein
MKSETSANRVEAPPVSIREIASHDRSQLARCSIGCVEVATAQKGQIDCPEVSGSLDQDTCRRSTSHIRQGSVFDLDAPLA